MSAETHVKEESDYVVTDYGQCHVVVKKEFEEKYEADVKKEACSDNEDALAGLYAGHVVKDELVLGPECPHRPDDTLVVREWALGDADGCPLASGARGGAQLALRDCYVRLERLPQREVRHTELRTAPHEDTLAILTDNESDIEGQPHIDCQNEPCIVCGKRFALKSDLLKHIMIHIHVPQGSDIEEEDSHIAVGRQREPYGCDICSETFISKSNLMKHALSHIHVSIKTEREEYGYEAVHYDFPSPDCSVFASEFSETSVMNHKHDIAEKTNRHTTENTYICDYCGRTLKKKVSLMYHIKFHLKNPEKPNNIFQGTRKKHSCEQRGRQFSSLSTLKTHRRSHTGEKPYACEVCNKKFARLETLRTHEPIHMSQKPYTCEICKRAFVQRSSLMRHGLIHGVKDKKSYSCEQCNKEFSNVYVLNAHLRVHTGEKPYCCEVCQKKFTQAGDFKAHKRIHTGEKPYVCEKCKKSFRRQTDLSRHRYICIACARHKPYGCEVCGEKFYRRHRLTEHRRKHTGDKPYECEICLKRYAYNDLLTKHLKVHMSKKKSYK